MSCASHYIAETDGSGAVCWLWEVHSGGRKVRPVRDLSGLEGKLATAVVDGASLSAAVAWLARTMRGDAHRPNTI